MYKDCPGLFSRKIGSLTFHYQSNLTLPLLWVPQLQFPGSDIPGFCSCFCVGRRWSGREFRGSPIQRVSLKTWSLWENTVTCSIGLHCWACTHVFVSYINWYTLREDISLQRCAIPCTLQLMEDDLQLECNYTHLICSQHWFHLFLFNIHLF